MSLTHRERLGVFSGVASIVCGLVSLGAFGVMSAFVHDEGDWMIMILSVILAVGAPVLGALLGIVALVPRRSRIVGATGLLLSPAIGAVLGAMRFGLFAN
jgi:hypothetical protein